MRYLLLIILLSLFTQNLLAQKQIEGHIHTVEGKEHIPLEGVQILWLDSSTGVISDEEGHFSIPQKAGDSYLVFRMAGYETDTMTVEEDHLHVVMQIASIDEVEISRRQKSTRVSTIDPTNTELISSLELTKAACCNLSETFETNATVDVAYSDAVTGAKRIKMLGLDGIYTQILNENYPAIRGLVQSYGLTYIPGPFLSGIQVSKGAASVQNGYESLAGEINVEYMKPQNAEPLFVNLYANNLGRQEANIALKHRFSPHISSMIMTHGSRNPRRFDFNDDGFLDMPTSDQFWIFNRWRWVANNGLRGQFGGKFLEENSQSGQVNYRPVTDRLQPTAYGVERVTRRWEAFNKIGYVFKNNPNSSFGSALSYVDHDQESFLGLNHYIGRQQSFFGKVLFNTSWGIPEQTFTTGISYRHDNYSESWNDSAFSRNERVPGAFAEYSFNKLDRLIYTLGARVDVHNLYGVIFTPRAHLKYDFSLRTTVRLSAGSGFRVPNVIADYTSMLISGRQLSIPEALKPERGWNYGFSLIHRIPVTDENSLVFDLSVYRTHFENQVVINRENAGLIRFSNLDGASFSEAVQLDASYELQEGIEFRLAGKYTRARTTFDGVVTDIPFLPRFRGLANMGLATKDLRWQYDINLQYIGTSRLPNTETFPDEYRLPERSPDFVQLGSQLTYRIKKPELELYVGGENLTNFTQENPIIASEDPFNPFFDAAMTYGPIIGARFYAGLRFTLPSNDK